MKKFNLSKKTTYVSNGQEKTYWANVGTMTQFDNGNMIVEIPAIGLTCSVFPDDRKPLEKPNFMKEEAQPAPSEPSVNVEDEDPVNPDDIPF